MQTVAAYQLLQDPSGRIFGSLAHPKAFRAVIADHAESLKKRESELGGIDALAQDLGLPQEFVEGLLNPEPMMDGLGLGLAMHFQHAVPFGETGQSKLLR